MNAARYFLPHIMALSTNSPFWLGMDTGLKSYRCKVFDKFPRTNIPDQFSSYGEYERFVNLLIKTNCIDNAKKIWWDIRPHPHFPTLEFRICDVPMRADETIAIAALIQATVAKLWKLHAANQSFRLYGRALLMENKWRAARYGIDGKMIDFGKETEVPVRDLVEEYLNLIDDVVDELGSRNEINYIHRILENGTGADRQLRIYQETGDLTKVVDYIVYETQAGLALQCRSGPKCNEFRHREIGIRSGIAAWSAQRGVCLPEGAACGESDADHGSGVRGNRRKSGGGTQGMRLPLQQLPAGGFGRAALDGNAVTDSRRHGVERRQHFRRSGATE